MKSAQLQIIGKLRGRTRAKIGLHLIRLGCWFCRAYRIEITIDGKKTSTYKPRVDVSVSLQTQKT